LLNQNFCFLHQVLHPVLHQFFVKPKLLHLTPFLHQFLHQVLYQILHQVLHHFLYQCFVKPKLLHLTTFLHQFYTKFYTDILFFKNFVFCYTKCKKYLRKIDKDILCVLHRRKRSGTYSIKNASAVLTYLNKNNLFTLLIAIFVEYIHFVFGINENQKKSEFIIFVFHLSYIKIRFLLFLLKINSQNTNWPKCCTHNVLGRFLYLLYLV